MEKNSFGVILYWFLIDSSVCLTKLLILIKELQINICAINDLKAKLIFYIHNITNYIHPHLFLKYLVNLV